MIRYMHGTVWSICCTECHEMAWYGMVSNGMLWWYFTILCDVAGYVMVWNEMVWSGAVWYDWYGLELYCMV